MTEKKKEKKEISKRTVSISTPYVSVTITSEGKDDNLKDMTNILNVLMDKYKTHHLIEDKDSGYG